VDRGRETEKASPQDGRTEGTGKRRAREGHPRGAQALYEGGKAGESCSLRPGRLAVLRARKREDEGVHALERSETWSRRGREDRKRGRGSPGGEGVKACARATEGCRRGRREEHPGKAGERALCRRRRQPLRSSARGSRHFPRGKAVVRVSIGQSLHASERSACQEKEGVRGRERRGRGRYRPGRRARVVTRDSAARRRRNSQSV